MKVKTSGNLSLSRAVWTLKPTEPALLEALQQAGHGRILAICLSHRGATSPALAERLLRPNMDALHDPHAMLGMNLAVERLNKAVRDKERIRVVTDYDVDGTTSSLILQATLKILGGQGVSYHIPDRMKEGYGFSVFAAEAAAKAGIQLIVTADIGVKDHAAVTRSRQLGMDVLVLDHHLPPGEDVPGDATAVLCPPQISCEYPNTSLAACGVSFKVAQAMLASHVSRDRILRSMLKLAAIGTVADVVDLLTQENRAIVALGLQALNQDRHSPGLASLLRVAGVTQGSITSRELGFRIGPRINAAGRMETATRVVELLTTGDPASAKAQAEQLDELNTQRRTVQEAMLKHAMRQVPEPPPPFIVVAEIEGPNWHRGVSGIVAARLRDTHNRPAAVIAISPSGATGSARSIPEVHAVRCLEAAEDLLERFGGHPAAAGFSLQPENVAALRERLEGAATEQLNGQAPALIYRPDAAVPVQEADFALLRALEGLAPHGKGNPEPLLLLKGGTIRNTRLIKEKHLKGSLRAGEHSVDFIWWGGGQHRAAVDGQEVEVLAKLGVNAWQGIERLQLTVEDARVL